MCTKFIDAVGQTQGKNHEYVHMCGQSLAAEYENHLGKVVSPALKSTEQRIRFFICPRPCLRIWSREIGSAVPLSATTASIYLCRHPPSGQSRVYQVTQKRTAMASTAERLPAQSQ